MIPTAAHTSTGTAPSIGVPRVAAAKAAMKTGTDLSVLPLPATAAVQAACAAAVDAAAGVVPDAAVSPRLRTSVVRR